MSAENCRTHGVPGAASSTSAPCATSLRVAQRESSETPIPASDGFFDHLRAAKLQPRDSGERVVGEVAVAGGARARPFLAHDPRLTRQIGWRDVVATREAMLWRRDDGQAIFEERARLRLWQRDIALHQPQLQPARDDQLGDALGVGDGHCRRDEWIAPSEGGQRLWQQIFADGVAGADGEGAAGRLRQVAHVAAHALLEFEHLARMLVDDLASGGQVQVAVAALQQTRAEVTLQRANLLAHGGLCHVQRAPGA